MDRIAHLLKSNKRLFSAEIIPPRNGAETEVIRGHIENLKKVPVDFISVTKGAGGSLRGGTLPIAKIITDQFNVCSLAHFTCRDFTIEEIENHLMDHHYFGIHNILALRGDPPDGQPDYFKNRASNHMYAWQLVEQISRMNDGKYLVRTGFDKSSDTGFRSGAKTAFCIGVAAYPEEVPFQNGVEYLKKKVDVGAEFALTQMLFDKGIYARYLDACNKAGIHIPIIPGLRIVGSLETAERVGKKFGVHMPRELIETLKASTSKEDAKKRGYEYTLRLAEDLLKLGAPGIHMFVMNDSLSSSQLLLELKN